MARHIVIGNATARMRSPRWQGFTLIELLVVMSIIATLLLIAVPRYFSSLDRSKETVLRQDLAVLRDSIDKFYGDTGRYPESLTELVERRYLRSVPIDPKTNSSATWVLVPDEGGEATGARDVRSGATGVGRDGTPFSTW